MRKVKASVFLSFLLLWAGLPFCPAVSATVAPDVSAKGAVLIEAESGRILLGKNENEQLAMASTTKIMTALLTLEEGHLDDVVTVTAEMLQVEGSAMGLRVGDKVSKEALVYGMLLSSGNDAANVAAISIAGSIEAFADRMNARAAEIGACNTHFVTPSGLDADGHYSTAYDMALIAREAMKNDAFSGATSQTSIAVSFGNPPKRQLLSNHNRLLRDYDGTIGVKTGFTKRAGRCLVSCAERDGVCLIAVTLNAPDDWQDHKSMLDYGFSLIKRTPLPAVDPFYAPVVGGDSEFVTVRLVGTPSLPLKEGEVDSIKRTVNLPRFLYAPVRSGDVVGEVIYVRDGEEIARLHLVATENIAMLHKEPTWRDHVSHFFAGVGEWILNLFH